ncbi:uncharacterized protein BT62DRAFT_916357 [Guyanagaster necrorhizus]|uniref:Uncharacterized protein n=1 Tax=Guyanagaster necrorhizus TaxID=856835 RepID=A0A9P8AX74_9AGAR|nr:uncharacterized protein BT62DRAFT_916357 [Guyanagaster necrorhizus MCA 3950]KAG7451323.1 hypothetical protein BT62DRAFT_916357 [Guyanagaster necrorhizus MCA 3950]
MTYIPHPSAGSQSTSSLSSETFDREHKKKAVQKFLARAELSNVTRALRTRLSYASHKTTNNAPNASLRDFESQSQSPANSSAFARSNTARRKPPTTSSYHANLATHGMSGAGSTSSPLRRGSSGPITLTAGLSSRGSFLGINGTPTSAGDLSSSASRQSVGGPTLFTSILAPPPTQQARTILNANDPPVAPPIRPAPSPQMQGGGVARSIAEGTRAHSKSRRPDGAGSGKGKHRARTSDRGDLDADGDVDMKAAQTLTSLLLHHRPSISGSVSSPRSSFDGSDAGSTQSYSQYTQSSARGFPNTGPPLSSSLASTSTISVGSYRDKTPPPMSNAPPSQQTTPRPAPTDNEAADLMLFLATSPSPARPSNKDAKDMAAYRTLGGGAGVLRAKGRVLFPTAPGEPNSQDAGRVNPRGTGSGLSRGGESSFTSSISSIGSDLGGRRDSIPGVDSGMSRSSNRSSTPAQLLPPPSFPSQMSVPSSPSGRRKSVDGSPRPGSAHDFNFHDFINASPSPSRGYPQHNRLTGLRADVGRKLFEGEQMRLGMQGGHMKRPDDRGLGAGIDLLKS